MTIVADANETWSHGFPTESLPCGDFVVTGEDRGFIVERKEFTDFVSSYRSGNLFNQLGRCMDQIPVEGPDDVEYEVILLIEGKRQNAIHYANASHYEIRRVIASIIAKMPVKLMFTRNRSETADFIEDLDGWVTDDEDTSPHTVREVEKVPDEKRTQYILEGLPGVSAGRAQDLEDHFGSARAVFEASEDELQEVSGIGPKTAEKIVDAIT